MQGFSPQGAACAPRPLPLPVEDGEEDIRHGEAPASWLRSLGNTGCRVLALTCWIGLLPIEWWNSARCMACEAPVLPAAQVGRQGKLYYLW